MLERAHILFDPLAGSRLFDEGVSLLICVIIRAKLELLHAKYDVKLQYFGFCQLDSVKAGV